MMDGLEDRQDAWLKNAAQDYHAPPPVPRAEMWERIQAARRGTAVTPLRRRNPWMVPLAVAATLLLGIAIGRFALPSTPAAAPGTSTVGATSQTHNRGGLAAQLVTADHLSQAETFLTEFGAQPAEIDLPAKARQLLATTRLLLDSKRVENPATRQLLEDLEFVLVQIATLDPQDRHEELGLIADGLAQNHLRTRLRNAVPTGGATRL